MLGGEVKFCLVSIETVSPSFLIFKYEKCIDKKHQINLRFDVDIAIRKFVRNFILNLASFEISHKKTIDPIPEPSDE